MKTEKWETQGNDSWTSETGAVRVIERPRITCPELCELQLIAQANNWMNTKRAVELASFWHFGQKRRSGGEAVSHPAHVAITLFELNVRSDVVIAAALLHDVIEDNAGRVTLVDLDELDAEVSALVDALTNRNGEDEVDYFCRVRFRTEAIVIKIVDRLHNLETMPHAMTHPRMRSYIEETRTYVLPLCDRVPRISPYYHAVQHLKSSITSLINIYEYFLPLVSTD